MEQHTNPSWRSPAVLVVLIAAMIGFVGAYMQAYKPEMPVVMPNPGPVSLKERLNRANVLLTGGQDTTGFVSAFDRDPALQALARDVLAATGGKKFRSAVHLDVINGKYKTLVDTSVGAAGYLQPHRYGDIDKVKQASVLHWNEIYSDRPTQNFNSILQ